MNRIDKTGGGGVIPLLWAALSVATFGGCGSSDKADDAILARTASSASSKNATNDGGSRSMRPDAKCVRRAVLVGVDDYARFPDLRFAGADVELIRESLRELGFKPENIVALTTAAGRAEERFAPNKANIEWELKRLLTESGPDDMIFVMFTGHGFQTENYGGYKDYVGFAPSDASPNKTTVVDFSTTISLSKLFDDLEASAAKFKCVLVDACRENLGVEDEAPSSKSLARTKALRNLDAPPGVAILQSCGEGEFSWENPASGHGVFTQFFAESLTELGDANEDGVVTFWEATARACDAVKRETSNRDVYKTGQTPRLRGDMTDFVLADVNTAKAKERFEAAAKAREAGRYATALKEIDAALKLMPEKAEYVEEKARIEREKTTADAKRFANEAWEAYNKNGDARTAADVAEAISMMTESLAVLDDALNRNALDVFEAELKRLGGAPGEGPNLGQSPTSTSKPGTGTTPTGATSTAETGTTSTSPTSMETGATGDWFGEYEAGTLKSLEVDGITYNFHYCPPGTFQMGSPESESGRNDASETQRQVTLTNGFWMLETEVTQAMWKAVMGSNPSNFSSSGDGSSKASGMGASDFPVENVDWSDCQNFIKKLNSLGFAPKGFQFRLPTEAEWEYACRAGSTSAYSFGSDGEDLTEYGNVADASAKRKFPYWPTVSGKDGYVFTSPVKSFEPNAWGLYDMHGNVWEWCEDRYDANCYENQNVARDSVGATTGSGRVLRGGSWLSAAEDCRSARRGRLAPTDRSYNLGFRLALGREL